MTFKLESMDQVLYEMYENVFGIAGKKFYNYILFFITEAFPHFEKVFDHVINGSKESE